MLFGLTETATSMTGRFIGTGIGCVQRSTLIALIGNQGRPEQNLKHLLILASTLYAGAAYSM